MPVELICQKCGKKFKVAPYLKNSQKYCSKTCFGKATRKEVKLICESCGKTFIRSPSLLKKGKTHFCSQECYDKKRITRKEVECATCGKIFVIRIYLYKESGNYCSNKCYHESTKTSIKRNCIYCGEPFNAQPSQIKLGGAKYCSHECSVKNRIKQIEKICPRCGKAFKTLPTTIKKGKGKYCSVECAGKSISRENHYLWNNGSSYSPYCPKFSNNLKERVRKFWNRKCGICGKDESEEHKRLPIHHVNYEKMACCNNIQPLFIPLCWSCHAKTNHNKDVWEEHLTNFIMIYFNGNSYLPK
jgi:hypothetical protein